MQDRRNNQRIIGSSELCNDAMLYHQRQATQLSALLLTMRCGVKVLVEPAKVEALTPEPRP